MQQETRASSAAQEAFRTVIAAGYYPANAPVGTAYMCFALDDALAGGVITQDQHQAGVAAINSVLCRSTHLTICMASAMLGRRTSWEDDCEWSNEHGVDLYMNWDERAPTLEFHEWTDEDL